MSGRNMGVRCRHGHDGRLFRLRSPQAPYPRALGARDRGDCVGPHLAEGLFNSAGITGYVRITWHFYQPTLFVSLLRAVLWLGVFFLAMSLCIRSATRAVIGIFLTLIAMFGNAHDGARSTPVPHAFESACTGKTPRICTPLPFATSLSDLDRGLRPALNLLPPDSVTETVETHRLVAANISGVSMVLDSATLDMLPERVPTRNEVLASFAYASFMKQCGDPTHASETNTKAYLAFLSKATHEELGPKHPDPWFASLPSTPARENAVRDAREIAAYSDPEFTAWLAENGGAIEGCARF